MDTLEHELASVLSDLRCSPRQARALGIRLGWDGGGGSTLAVAAEATGYTRERVRQLEDRVRAQLPGRAGVLRLTRRAVDLLEALAPAPREELAERLVAAGIASVAFDPAGVLRAAEFAGVRTLLFEQKGLVLRRPDRERMRAARSLTARLARGSGPVHLRAVAAMLAEDADDVRRLLALEPGLRWLDADREWLALPGRPSRASRTIAKMLTVADSLTLAEIDGGLRRASRSLLLPRPVLRAYCAALPWLELDPDTDVVRALEPPDPARLLTPLERSLVEIFRAEAGVLRLSEAARRAEEAGLNRASATIYLVRSPVIQTVARGRYALCGGRAAPAWTASRAA